MAKARSNPIPPKPVRIAQAHFKLVIAIVAGMAFGLALLAFQIDVTARLLAGWDVGLVVYLALAARFRRQHGIKDIRKRAAEQDEGGFAILLLSIVATFASLVAVVFALVGAKHGNAPLAIALTIVTIVLSWTFVHTIFAFHYAHEYYGKGRDDIIGGLDFPGDKAPDYSDFLYFSLVIGMTSQVSDVQITSKVIRRMASMHGVLSFFFNLVVLALTVNVVANLI
ncbi:DUF1345 domain-containing protein [Undibacter mobilis]|uniref:DUF1345 domain-containing protein n=1 Tax=Undibacter mobilis TaxID=2292256 RepID=A0A371B8C2_9BRAD|nr:DUF1345 domain-containing protein [Undibacter mobilis]RDV03846.1 DUF1345 domain-containing protein [Undibacter mobilis]